MERRLIPVRLDTYKPLREVVFETLREAIISGILKPGERMMEIQLAEELGVSRTPVREAIRKLELEGFVVMIPRKGAYVSDISFKDINDIFEIRGSLEMLAAGLACERITDDELEKLEWLLVQKWECIEKNDLETMVENDTLFHEALYRASRNDRMWQIVSNLREQIQRFRTTSLGSPGRMKEAWEEHKDLVEAISDRNISLAQELAARHIDNAENRLLETLRQRGHSDESNE
ncbi:MAG: GntR family transcriptional regulator [Methylocystaceae bacterium]